MLICDFLFDSLLGFAYLVFGIPTLVFDFCISLFGLCNLFFGMSPSLVVVKMQELEVLFDSLSLTVLFGKSVCKECF